MANMNPIKYWYSASELRGVADLSTYDADLYDDALNDVAHTRIGRTGEIEYGIDSFSEDVRAALWGVAVGSEEFRLIELQFHLERVEHAARRLAQIGYYLGLRGAA